MYIKFPIRELIRYSIALSIGITVFLFISVYLQDMELRLGIYRSLVAGSVLMTTAVVSILLILVFEKKEAADSGKYTKLRFCIGSLINAVLMFLFQFCREVAETYGLFPSELYDLEDMHRLHGWELYLLMFCFSLMVYGLVHLLHNFILLQHRKTHTELEISLLRSVNAETTNQLLRQQVQPHFLFNALTVLKSLIKTNPKTAEVYLLRLSDFLRTSFSQNQKGIATLRDEIKLCSDYLEMQKIRFDQALDYVFDIPDAYLNDILPFFSLQTLAENAIKHNELTDENPLFIRIVAENGWLKVENNLQRKKVVDNSTGSGLSNLSERYKLLTGEQIQIHDNGEFFVVAFKIISHEDRNH